MSAEMGIYPGPQPRVRAGLGPLVVAWGIQAIVTQSLLLREALVLMFGSEFAWGVVLFAWLLGVAIGGIVGGALSRRLRRPDIVLVVVLLLLSAATCAELWVFRGARGWLGVAPGELLPLAKTALAAVLFIPPTSALVGLAFPLACSLPREDESGEQRGAGPLAGVYALEALGSLIGGAVFSFWAVERLAPIETALLCGVIMGGACCWFLARGEHRVIATAAGAVAVAALLVGAFAGRTLEVDLIMRRWRSIAPGYALRAYAESKYQNLAVGQRVDQYTLYCDGQVSVDFPDPYTFVPLAHFWMCEHPEPRRVLVLGGGAEGLLAEILLHPVVRVDYVEPDPMQIELIEPLLTEADRAALADPRVRVHHLDARYYVKTQRDAFDLVIARLPEPTSALRARLYTTEFFGELRRAMTDRAVLCTTAFAPPASLSRIAAEYLASLRATLREHFPEVIIGWGDPAQVLVATAPGLVTIDPAVLVQRYVSRGVKSKLFDPLWFEGATDWLDPSKLAERAAELDEAGGLVQISTDLRPAVYMQRLALWERMTAGPGEQGLGHGRREGMIERLRGVGWSELLGALVVVSVVYMALFWLFGRLHFARVARDIKETVGSALLHPPYNPGGRHWSRARARAGAGMVGGAHPTPSGGEETVGSAALHPPYERGGPARWLMPAAVIWSVATTGFATMALSIVWLFAFQNLYGYVYQRIGWIIAVFMAGLVVGCAWVDRRSRRYAVGERAAGYLWRRLVAVDVLLAALALLVPVLLTALGAMSGPTAFVFVEWAVLVMVAMTGVLGGSAFALAGGLQLAATGRAGEAAGGVIGADHAGACLGALLTGILLVPVFGTAACAFLLAGIKASAVALLLVGGKANGNEPRPSGSGPEYVPRSKS